MLIYYAFFDFTLFGNDNAPIPNPSFAKKFRLFMI